MAPLVPDPQALDDADTICDLANADTRAAPDVDRPGTTRAIPRPQATIRVNPLLNSFPRIVAPFPL
ncbi:hypothetical protein N5079_06680 [Planotetraspora sp. A-T 1434]|uniref:hypothetical protein n=1 Tax=Planotetraspora sp. A-T 1434 TaxID=2979219 RepID=UPI0021BEEC39|nr:hypothetical protein [Planotetraspora sp. A-T 1434]MCT9929903.1 hypothetical protein [Planotetraspora sp. A-T 1434]